MKIHLGYFLGIAAFTLAGCAAFFSVFGLSQLFAGASLAVIIMASALEFSKIVIASYLHSYWTTISKMMRIYFSLGVVVLVLITSAGIYGFLSSAFQKTANNLEVHQGEVDIIEGKVAQFQTKLDANNKSIDLKTKRINQLNDLRGVQESRIDNGRGGRQDIIRSSNEINSLNTEIDALNVSNSSLTDSIAKYNGDKIALQNKNTSSGEVGPLKYMAELTGQPMNVIVNYFILLLVLVFDPLAVCLVIATTSVFKLNLKNESVNENIVIEEELESNEDIAEEPIISEVEEPISASTINAELVKDLEVPKKIRREDIKEVKEMMNRGFTVGMPNNKSDRPIFGKDGRIK